MWPRNCGYFLFVPPGRLRLWRLNQKMPELPEVETMRRGILGIRGARVCDIDVLKTQLRPILIEPKQRSFRNRVVGKTVAAVERFGKRVAILLEGGDRIVFEPRMTGLVLLADPPTKAHLRFALHLDGVTSQTVWFWDRRGLGNVRLLSDKQIEQQYGPQKLGPDALKMTVCDWQDRLGKSDRPIKVAMLDQKCVAGIGNLYASEILHVAGVDPRKRCRTMNEAMWQAVDEATQQVLKLAINYEGSTLGDGTYRNALNKRGRYQNHHRVYMKADQTCSTCGDASIRKIVQAQRSTFFCPACQRKAFRK